MTAVACPDGRRSWWWSAGGQDGRGAAGRPDGLGRWAAGRPSWPWSSRRPSGPRRLAVAHPGPGRDRRLRSRRRCRRPSGVLLAVKPDVAEAVPAGPSGRPAPGACCPSWPACQTAPARGRAAARGPGGPGHAQHPGPGRSGRVGHLGGQSGHGGRPRLGRGRPLGRRPGGAAPRTPPRRGDRGVRLGPGLRLLGGRGPDRSRGAAGLPRDVSRTLVVETLVGLGPAARADRAGPRASCGPP